ncbi:hypothetical protein Micbo1qcDRAFT_27594 [Microdochium bolleyi]|uniref:Zn(2)-C6 fungal-type domain-containing protein n=1 Tax=Microdochium bolleyi TaxID=196109 RepID=A0A136JEN5_9PEZI|nr:hypothetical protein Micbo1qcDRAFT_27594 [Microdochium bolleyi]
MTAALEPRRRAHRPKVKTGCACCKRRHIRCGEERPECLRCQIAGLKCEYIIPLRQQSVSASPPAAKTNSPPEEELAVQPPSPSNVVRCESPDPAFTLAPALPWNVPTGARVRGGGLTPSESLYFENFQLRMAENLSRCGLADFWYRTILREADTDDCVFHCIVGIGALGRVFENRDGRSPSPTITSFLGLPSAPQGSMVWSDLAPAIRQYSRAISSFRDKLAEPIRAIPCRTIMLVTILLIVYEMLQGNAKAVDRLVATALLTLKEKMAASKINDLHVLLDKSRLDDEGVIEAIYLIPRIAAMRMAMCPSALDFSCEWLLQMGTHPMSLKASMPPSNLEVEDFEHSWNHFFSLATVWYNHMHHNVAPKLDRDSRELVEKLEKQQASILARTNEWRSFLQARLLRTTNALQREHEQVCLFAARVSSFLIMTALDPLDSVWDTLGDRCYDALNLLEKALGEIPDAEMPTPLLDDKVVPMIHYITQHCRDKEVREHGLRLLERCITKTSPWDTRGSLLGMQAFLEVEEAGRDAKGHIPPESRYKWVLAQWNDEHTEYSLRIRCLVSSEERLLTVTTAAAYPTPSPSP